MVKYRLPGTFYQALASDMLNLPHRIINYVTGVIVGLDPTIHAQVDANGISKIAISIPRKSIRSTGQKRRQL
ncbi:MAG: hypothetical protein QNJ29_14190, partial [Rhizobiaceae bacterium]|nr:hypothetical protein [Rhizobiaceae bacterium]